jgi:hypothetical protein
MGVLFCSSLEWANFNHITINKKAKCKKKDLLTMGRNNVENYMGFRIARFALHCIGKQKLSVSATLIEEQGI